MSFLAAPSQTRLRYSKTTPVRESRMLPWLVRFTPWREATVSAWSSSRPLKRTHRRRSDRSTRFNVAHTYACARRFLARLACELFEQSAAGVFSKQLGLIR